MHHKFLRLRQIPQNCATSAIWLCVWRAIWVTYLSFTFWAFNWRSDPLFYLSLLWALYWRTDFDGLGCCGFSTDILALFAAASSGSVHLRFPSVMELSICARYVNCSSDHFVMSSNLAFWVWCIFSIFSKRSLKFSIGEVTAASASLCLPRDFISLLTYLINQKIE